MSLRWACEVCEQPKGKPCVDTITKVAEGGPRPLLARGEHYARALPPRRQKEPAEPKNQMLA